MEYAPVIDWGLARRVARFGSRDLPDRTLPELRQLVADLRVTARRAGEAGAEHMGLDSVGAGTVRVVDWAGWGAAVRAMTDGVVAELGLPARAPGPLTALRGV
ncbi:MAG TPA: hypothetical protein PKA93_14905, partial [Arachnia sp.]|nr:hypothetical protein [Arachnia sp.]